MSVPARSASPHERRRPPQIDRGSAPPDPNALRGSNGRRDASPVGRSSGSLSGRFGGAGRPGRDGVKSSRTGMRFDPLMAIEDWKALGVKIVIYSEATAWWLGDWLAFGQMKYGRRYKEGIDLTGLEYQTLRNYAVVARRFELSRRRDNLSFQHHAEVCALADDDQDFWLDLAAERHWSKTEFRRRVRAASTEPPPTGAGTTVHLVLEPQRDKRWRQAAKQSDCALEDWITRTLDAAAVTALDDAP
jgi:hypothetical protein